ncbi:hypothetical protein MKX01_040333 [Papaver californicum]|nr:hypothetical protein MKX01_040333 [Papaver californicum]
MEKFVIFLVLICIISNGFCEELNQTAAPWRIHTLFSVECQNYFDWQTVGLVHSYKKAKQPGPITRLLSCTDEAKRKYKGMNLAPTFEVPSMSRHPKTGDWYPAINKPAGIVHWLKHSKDAENVDWVVGLRHKISDDLMIYPGYVPRAGVEPILLHYGLPFTVGNWSFSKLDHHEDAIVYDCNRLFPEPPYPREVQALEAEPNKRHGLFLSIECICTLNEGLVLHHASRGCSKPNWSKYLSFLKSKTFANLTQPRYLTHGSPQIEKAEVQQYTFDKPGKPYPKIHTVFSTECTTCFDWQTVGFMHSFRLSGQPGDVTRLLSCTDEDLKRYAGHDLAPTHNVPSMSRHPLTGNWYPAINKPAAVLHWLNHAKINAEYIVIS